MQYNVLETARAGAACSRSRILARIPTLAPRARERERERVGARRLNDGFSL